MEEAATKEQRALKRRKVVRRKIGKAAAALPAAEGEADEDGDGGEDMPAPVVALAAVSRGEIVFEELPLVAAQALPSADALHQELPLFCWQCCKPSGSTTAMLALASGRVARKDLLQKVASCDGDDGVHQWLATAGKTHQLPSDKHLPDYQALPVVDPECLAAVDGSSEPCPCFCSRSCRSQYQQQFLATLGSNTDAWLRLCKHAVDVNAREVLLMAAQVCMHAAWPGGSVRTAEETVASLSGVLKMPVRQHTDSLQAAHIEVAHGMLLGLLPAGQQPKAMEALSLTTYTRVVQVILSWSQSLSGLLLPSPLSAYCDALLNEDVSQLVRADALMTIIPTVMVLAERHRGIDSDTEVTYLPPKCQFLGKDIPLRPPRRARAARPVRVPGVFTDEDIALVKRLSSENGLREQHKHQGEQWGTRYLQTRGLFKEKAAHLRKKILDAAKRVDEETEGWGVLGAASEKLVPRCLEHHVILPGGGLPDPAHYDEGSAITVDIMLNTPGEDFEGGMFCTMESDGSYAEHPFSRGDAMVFLSHKPHSVRPVLSGVREVLVVELWEGIERECEHRCPLHAGTCALECGGSLAKEPEPRGYDQFASLVADDAAEAFSGTAFHGKAFYPRMAALVLQSDKLREASRALGRAKAVMPNVKFVFEEPAPYLRVRALRNLNAGEWLVAAPWHAGSPIPVPAVAPKRYHRGS